MTTPVASRGQRLRFARRVLASSIAALVAMPIAAHADRTWDATPLNGTLEGGAGFWNALDQNWTTDGGLTNTTWDSLLATFGGTTGGIVTINSGTVNATGLVFNTTGDLSTYTIASALPADTLTLTGAPTITTNADATISAVVAGTAGFTKLGTSSLTLSGANTLSGVTRIGAGSLILDNSLALQNAILNMNAVDTGTLSFGALTSATIAGVTGSRDLDLRNNALAAVTLTLTNTGTPTYTGTLSGSGGIVVQAGAGTHTFSGLTSYTGTTVVNSGTLVLGGGSGDSTVNTSNGSITVNGGTLRLDKAAGTLATAATSITINTGGTLNFGSASNLFASNVLPSTGDITLAGGALNFAAGTGISAASQTLNSLTVTSGTLFTATGVPLAGNVNDITITNAFNVSGGTPTINSGTVVTAGSLTISGGTLVIGGNHTARNTRLAPSSIQLNGGTVQINVGTTAGAMRGELYLASDVNVGGTAATTISRGTGTPTNEPAVVLNDPARIFNVADATNSSAADLTIATRLDAGGIVKTGAGTLALNSTGSTFTGNVLIQQGTLQFTGSNTADQTAFGAGAKPITITNNARLALAGANEANPSAGTKIFVIGTGGGTIDIASGRTMTLDDGTVAYNPGDTITTTTAQLQGSSTLTKVGAGTLTLGGGAGNFSASFTGNINHNLGLLNITNVNGAGNTGTITVDGSAGPTRLNYSNGTVMAIPMNLVLQNGAVFSAASNSHNLANTKTLTVNTGASASRFRVDDGAAATVSATNRTFVLNGALNGSGNLDIAGPSGANRGVLASSNTQSNYSGTISLDKNVAFENNPRFNGTIASGTGKTIGTATIKFVPQFFSGSAVDALLDLRDNGTGNNQTFSYGNGVDMSLTGGQINVGTTAAGSATPSIGSKFVLGALNLGSGNTLTVNSANSNNLEFSGVTTLGGSATFTGTSNLNLSGGTTGGTDITKEGVGTLTIGASAGTPYTGTANINAGTLVFGGASAIGGTGASVVAANGTIFGAGFAGATQANFIDRTAVNANTFVFGLAANTANNLSLTGFAGARLGAIGSVTMSGALSPDATTYRVGGGSAGHVLTISGTDSLSGANSLDVGANGTGIGVVALTGTNSFTGNVTISGGELLRPATNASLGNAANVITGDGGGIQFPSGAAFDLFALRNVTFGAGGFILDTNGNNFTPSAPINGNSGTGALTKTGAGTLTFTSTNTFSGATNVNGGVLEFADPALLGATSNLGISGGTVRYTGTGAATLGKTVTLGAVAGAATLDIPNGSANLTIDTVISGGPAATNLALTKTGPGTLSLFTAVNTFTGDIVINEGTLATTGQGNADPTRLGGGAKSVTFNNGSTFRITTGDFNPSAGTKRIVVGTGGAIFNSAGATGITLDDASQFSGTGNLFLAGGVTNLGNAYIGYTGNITVGPGATLRAFNANANPLGDTIGITTVQNGGVLNIQATGTNNESVIISGTGINFGGALINSGTVAANLGGTVTMTGATSMGGSSTGSLTLTNAVTGTFPITKVGTATLALGGANGTALEATALNILGGAFLLNNDAGVDVLTAHNQNRLADNLTVTLNNAAFDLRGVNLTTAGSTSETIGSVNFAGQGTLRQSTATPTFTTTTLNFAIGNRSNRGVLLLDPGTVAGTTLGTTNRYFASNTPTLVNGGTMVAPHFIDASNANFLTYGVNGFVAAAATSSDISVSTAADILDDADGAVLAGPASAFVAKLNGAVTGGSLTLTGGGLIALGSAIHSTPIDFGSEGVLYAPTGAAPIFTGLPTASALVKAGPGSIRFQNTGQINNAGLANAELVVHDGLLEIGDRTTTSDNNSVPATVTAYLTGGGLNFYHSQTIAGLSGTGGTVRVGANTSGNTAKLLTVNQNENAGFSGVIDSDDNNGSDANFTKSGSGKWTYSGSGRVGRIFTANFGEVIFTGSGSFNSSGLSSTDRQQIALNQGGVITLDNTDFYVADRLNTNRTTAAANFAISGGTFNYIGNSSVASTEAFGGTFAGSFGVGSDVMNVVAGTGQSAAVTFGYTFNRSVGASVLIRGTNLGGARGAADVASVVMGTTTTLTGGAGAAGTPLLGVIKGVFADSVVGGVDTYGLSTYDTGTDATSGDANDIGIRRLTASEHATTFAGGDTALSNVRLTSAVTGIDSATTVNAIHFAGGASIAGSGTLTINSGTILSANNGSLGANSLDVANLAFTGGEAIFYTPTDLTVTSALTGATILTKGGSGRLVLAGTNSFTGNPIVNGGLLAIDGNARLGAVANNVNLNNGGGIQATTSFTLDNSGANKRGVILGAAGGRIDVPNLSDTFVVSGTVSGGVGAVNAVGIGATTGSFARETTVLTKTGPGTLTLTGGNTFTGRLDINGGIVVVGNGVSGSLGANSHVAVNDTGTLKGTGTIGGTVTVNNGGTLAPGNSPGLLNTGSLTLSSGSILSLELNSTVAATGYDQLNVTGSVALAGNLSLSLGFVPTENVDTFFVILNDGAEAINGTFAGLPHGATFTSEGYMWQISYQADAGTTSFTGGNDVALMAVPEPSSVMALLAGLGSLLSCRRRRRE